MIDWHCPRPQLAQNILDRYKLGFTPLVVLFAPRKQGKTQFVNKDVIPMAKDQGYVSVITVDFWADPEDPEACIIKAFSHAFNQLPAKLQAKAMKIKQVSGGVSLSKKGLGLDAKATGSAPLFETALDAVSIFEGLFGDREEGTVFLFLDEIQHLATKESYKPIASTLRTFLNNKNDKWLHTIMTGSSQNGLQQMFKQTDAPFYGHGSIEQYQPLGSEFILHMMKCYKAITGKELNKAQAVSAFRDLSGRPDKYRALMERMVTNGIGDFTQSKELFPDIFEVESMSDWEDLSEDESLVLQVMALATIRKLPVNPYADLSKKYMSDRRAKPMSKSSIQNALDRLKKKDWVINPSRGVWRFENDELKRFVLVDILSEKLPND